MAATMLAAVFVGPGRLELQDRPVPEVRAGDDVLLEVEATGLCGTDLHILSDPPGHPATPGTILGHEIIARVVDAGPEAREIRPGQRVAVDANLKCGLCRPCRRGRENHCENWTTIGIFRDGGFARYLVAPRRSLHPVSPELDLRAAVWTELLSCVIGSTDRIAIQPGQTAVIVGAGPAGMLHGLMFAAAGARVAIADLAPYRLEFARKAGFQHVIDVSRGSLAEEARALTDGNGADVTVDAVGSQFGTCLELTATGGKLSLFGMNAAAAPTVEQHLITRRELTVFGSYVGTHTFPRAIEVLEAGAIRPQILLSHDLTVARLPAAIASAQRGEAMKVMVRPE